MIPIFPEPYAFSLNLDRARFGPTADASIRPIPWSAPGCA